jgi:hypothetical protein
MKRTLLSVKQMLHFHLDRVKRMILAKGLSTIVRARGARSAARAADALSSIAPVR